MIVFLKRIDGREIGPQQASDGLYSEQNTGCFEHASLATRAALLPDIAVVERGRVVEVGSVNQIHADAEEVVRAAMLHIDAQVRLD